MNVVLLFLAIIFVSFIEANGPGDTDDDGEEARRELEELGAPVVLNQQPPPMDRDEGTVIEYPRDAHALLPTLYATSTPPNFMEVVDPYRRRGTMAELYNAIREAYTQLQPWLPQAHASGEQGFVVQLNNCKILEGESANTECDQLPGRKILARGIYLHGDLGHQECPFETLLGVLRHELVHLVVCLSGIDARGKFAHNARYHETRGHMERIFGMSIPAEEMTEEEQECYRKVQEWRDRHEKEGN